MTTSVIQLKHVTKRYDSLVAVDDLSLTVEKGEFLVLLGQSGCGKTSTLRLIAGLERPDIGEIWLNGKLVASADQWVPPERRHIGMVFQDYALFPHLTVSANVAFALKTMPANQRTSRIEEMLTLVGLGDLGDRHPHQLSGGQQQRVALARALAPDPAVVLLDEPFSNLDAVLRKDMREEVRRILKGAGKAAVFVTHDQEEALSIGDQIAVMRAGRLLQVGTPREVYLNPNGPEVAAFIGEANFLPGHADGIHVQTALGTLTLVHPATGSVEVMVRPEALTLDPDPMGPAVIQAARFLGYDQLIDLALPDGSTVQARVRSRDYLTVGMRVDVSTREAVMAYPNGKS